MSSSVRHWRRLLLIPAQLAAEPVHNYRTLTTAHTSAMQHAVKAKFHYTSWFELDSVMEFGFEPVCDQLQTSSESASVMEFGFYRRATDALFLTPTLTLTFENLVDHFLIHSLSNSQILRNRP